MQSIHSRSRDSSIKPNFTKNSDRLSRIFTNTNKIKGDLNNMFNFYVHNKNRWE